MGFTGSGTLDFDSKHGTLEYATQEILQTSDVKVLNTLKESNSAFKDVRSTLSSWSGRALRYYDQDTSVHNSILSDLKSLTGVVAGLPGEISSSVSTALVPVKNAQLQLYNQVGAIASDIPKINTSLEAVKTSIQGLSSSLDQINANISNIGSNKPQDAPQVSFVKDFTPDYSDAINDISDIVGSIRDSILGFDGSIDVSSIHPDLHRDLDKIKGVIEDIANKYKTPEGFDLNGFTADVQDLVGNFSEGVVESMVNVMLPEMAEQYADFVENFTNSFSEEMERQNNSLVNALAVQTQSLPDQFDFNGAVVAVSGPEVLAIHKQIADIYELQSQFHADTISWMENLDGRLNKNFTNLSRDVRHSGSSSGSALDDVIDSFDDTEAGSSISTGTSLLSSIWNLFKDYAPEVTGFLSWAHIKEHMENLHADATQLIQLTGVSRKEALETRSAVQENIFSTFGMATTSKDDRATALADALRSGMVLQDHLVQASEVNIATSKLLQTNFDFSQGWAKSLMVSKDNADDYLENVALSLDTFSNNLYVSVDKLMASADKYVASANIFTKDFKGFSESINASIQAQAAQEAANIQSMDPVEFLREFAWTDMSNVSEAMLNRMTLQFGLGGNELLKARDILRAGGPEANALMSQLMATTDEKLDAQLKHIQAGGSEAESSLAYMSNVWGNSWEQNLMMMDEAQRDAYLQMSEDLLKDYSVPDSEAATRVDVQTKTLQAANLTELDYLRNIAGAFEEKGVVKDIYNKLSEMGISGSFVATVGAIATTSIMKALFKGFKAGGFSGVLETIKGASSGLGSFTKGIPTVFSKILEALKGFTGSGIGNIATKVFGALGVAKAGWDVGSGASKAGEWTGREDDTTKFAAGYGGLIGGTGKGLSGAIANGGKWAAIGSLIAPGIGTAIGGILGAAFGAIGGENIAKGITKVFDFKDSFDIFMEEHLGIVGRVIGAATNIPFEFIKNVFGGWFKGLGEVVTGIKSGFEKFTQGDILGGLADLAMGIVNGFKEVISGPFKMIKSLWEDLTMSAKDRVKKRRGELKQATDEAEKAQDETDKKIDGINKKYSDVTHKKPIFTATKGRKGTLDASGLNRYSFADKGASKILSRNQPIEHIPGEAQTAAGLGLTESKFIDDLPNESTVVKGSGFGNTDKGTSVVGTTDLTSEGNGSKPVIYGSKEYEEITGKPKTSDITDGSKPVIYGSKEYEEITGKAKTSETVEENLTEIDYLKNISDALTDSGLLGKIYATLSGGSILSGTADFASGIVSKGADIISGIAGSGMFGLPGVVASKLFDKARGKEEQERIDGPVGTVGKYASTLLGSGLYGVPGVAASKLIDKFTLKDAASVLGNSYLENQGLLGETHEGIMSAMGLSVGTLGAAANMPGGMLSDLRGPILNGISAAGPENISAPIVDSINTNMASVVDLLTQLVNNSAKVDKPDSRDTAFLATRKQKTMQNTDNTNSTVINNYQGIGV